ncbi:MAG: hypothetical protein Q8916_04820 [Bacteroidota bacterium]|nr:hypothetical protein [Bacteroidota bacterium]MDP4229710.1 hypothetical protein [Bacteroidota bacterium]MDP4237489.1 hypothetical protein [Bacteroidota bacterium]
MKTLAFFVISFFTATPLLVAQDSGQTVVTHSSTTKTTTYTILGMDQTTGIVVIAVAVLVVILLVALASRSTKSETTIVK